VPGLDDAPGNTTGNAFNNDLDLTVIVGGNVYKGNVFSGPNSVTGGNADRRNNVESVFLPAGVTGRSPSSSLPPTSTRTASPTTLRARRGLRPRRVTTA